MFDIEHYAIYSLQYIQYDLLLFFFSSLVTVCLNVTLFPQRLSQKLNATAFVTMPIDITGSTSLVLAGSGSQFFSKKQRESINTCL